MSVIFLGSGNLATHLATALHAAGVSIAQVYSPTLSHAQALADLVHCTACASISDIRTDADAYIFSVKDDALPRLIERMASRLGEGRGLSRSTEGSAPSLQAEANLPTLIHTAGSVPLQVFAESGAAHLPHGVLYPMQTFTKGRQVDFSVIPCFIEGSTPQATAAIEALASKVSGSVQCATSAQRRKLHLAAVFACNLTNHCYRLAERILEEEGIDFRLYLPLIQETADKVSQLSPREAQTGPMVRYDTTVMQAQLSLISNPLTQQIYRLMADSIHADYDD